MKKMSALCLLMPILASSILGGCGGKLPDLENHILENAYREDASVFRTLYSSEVYELNYLKTISAIDTAISTNVIDSLVDYDSKGNILPGLASSWESNEDATKWTFHLRDDITWVTYKGEYYADVIADDFVAAAEYVNDAANDSDCQYMYTTGSVVKNAGKYYEYTKYLFAPDTYENPPKEVVPSDIGVKALDNKTLVYELEQPCTFFPSVLTYTSYLPICRKYLNEVGSMFARNNKNLLYNGAYVLSYFQPLEKQILVKNPSYWDAGNVYIDRVENYYDTEAGTIGPERYMEGSIDKAVIRPDKLEHYLGNPEMKDEIHRSRPDYSFSYFYAFNFKSNFDSRYEPENWEKAVVNENFRKAILCAINKTNIAKIYEPYEPESLVNNTFTPSGAIVVNGKDYIDLEPLKKYKDANTYSILKAVNYRNEARKELEKAGVTFPIKMLMPYNPFLEGWEDEARYIKNKLEATLGEDFIDVIVEQGGDTGYLIPARRSGMYAFMKCRWGADYDDPSTWTKPFTDEGAYMFWHLCSDENVKKIHDEWQAKIQEASNITSDIEKRMETYAEAESIILEHAIVIPMSIMNGDGYVMSKINEFEGEYSAYGIASQRYKFCRIYEDSMNMEEFEKEFNKWKEYVGEPAE
ncbi:peptide ABC transporter substrate-binding protein [Butyrivibrio sp. JL13D10]|uniref:peptide ABC transporter substrate-binding protein n=1 Tax=Butyrivibrio sp. JL13D10 TaxID=3236815 RepID=UPI0038B669C7